jgi:hypothetical protein
MFKHAGAYQASLAAEWLCTVLTTGASQASLKTCGRRTSLGA